MKKTAAKGKLPPHVALIILIPVILVLLLLNTGWLQGMVPAVTVYGQSYSALEFRYYFYDAYYDYVNEHAEHLAELGLDVSKALKDQSFDGEQTWQDHFKAEALTALEEDTLLLEAAEEAGYTAQEEVQAACDARLEELRQYCVDTGLKSLGDYFTSYYDTGMTQDLYLELYSGQILAESYRKALEEELGPSEADVEDYVAALGTAADYTADLSLAYFEAEARPGVRPAGAAPSGTTPRRWVRPFWTAGPRWGAARSGSAPWPWPIPGRRRSPRTASGRTWPPMTWRTRWPSGASRGSRRRRDRPAPRGEGLVGRVLPGPGRGRTGDPGQTGSVAGAVRPVARPAAGRPDHRHPCAGHGHRTVRRQPG